MSDQTRRLRELIAGEPFVAADCMSALTARIIEHVGFPAAYMGGHATSMFHYAIPDNGAYTPTEMITQATLCARAVDIPLIVDADQLGETVADIHRSVRGYEDAGVAGIHMEDEVPPKHSTYAGPMMSISDMQARVEAAVNARRDDDFVIITRSDEFYVGGGGGSGSLEEAAARGKAYAEAGADVFLPTFASPEQLLALAAEVPIPLAAYGGLQEGIAFSLATGFGTASAAREHHKWATHLFEHGELPEEAFAFPDKDALIRQQEHDDVISRWVDRTGRAKRAIGDPAQ
jgi:2-methylisocitrate lyase-like PEP mutase family enzyme